jgi:glutaminase
MNNVLALSPVQAYLERLHAELLPLRGGELASYIPELTRADPNWLGIALVTVDGHVYQVGDSREPFTVQSISKALSYGLALEGHGLEHVLAKVGVEPSGEAFNSISLEPDTGRPLNPMINAGAIATTGLIDSANGRDPMQHLLDTFARYTGRAMSIEDSVYRSESDTGHRNRAIAHLLYGHGILERGPDEIVDLYFRQCSILVTARDLALMAACLANSGVNPVTGVVALESRWVKKVLSVMSTCGMYDFSGAWVFDVGMPAKSGVGGGIMAVLPGQFGLGVFSPPLDEKGNSVRGIEACKRISSDFGIHLFDVPHSTSASVLRRAYDCSRVPSRRRRDESQQAWLSDHGQRICIHELQGELMFGSAESVALQVLNVFEQADALILDLKHLVDMDHASATLLGGLCEYAAEHNKHLFFTGSRHLSAFWRHLRKSVAAAQTPDWLNFDEADRAMEWCENELLTAAGIAQGWDRRSAFTEHYLCAGLSETETDSVRRAGTMVHFKVNEPIVRIGEPASDVFFVVEGEAEVWIETADNEHRRLRLTTIGPGAVFGEIGLLTGQQRTAHVTAATDLACLKVPFDALQEPVRAKMVMNMAGHFADMLKRNAELAKYLA